MSARALTGQIVGWCAVVFVLISYGSKKRARILLFKLLSNVCWVTQFIIIGAFTGAYFNIIAICRESLFYNTDKKWAHNPIWIVVLLAAYVVTVIFTWEAWYCILPFIGVCFELVAFYSKNTVVLRTFILISIPFWMTYSIFAFSLQAIISNSLSIIILAIALFSEIHARRKNTLAKREETNSTDKTVTEETQNGH